ncbi:hypothetical protein ACKAV7_004460 [Fusarium commune]
MPNRTNYLPQLQLVNAENTQMAQTELDYQSTGETESKEDCRRKGKHMMPWNKFQYASFDLRHQPSAQHDEFWRLHPSVAARTDFPKTLVAVPMWPVKRGPGAFLSKQITCWRGIMGDSIKKALLDHGEVGVLALCDQ